MTPLLLDLARKPIGAYQVDAHACVLFPKLFPDELLPASRIGVAEATPGKLRERFTIEAVQISKDIAIDTVRGEVNRAAEIAIAHELRERRELRKARDDAKLLLKLLDRIERDSESLLKGDVAGVAAKLAGGFDPVAPSFSPLVQILEGINSARAWTAELRKRAGIAPAAPSRSDPLARHFVMAMGAAYLAHRKEQPPHGRAGPFVDLVTTAWIDIAFPPRTELGDWLGRKIEALPTLTTKKSRQTG